MCVLFGDFGGHQDGLRAFAVQSAAGFTRTGVHGVVKRMRQPDQRVCRMAMLWKLPSGSRKADGGPGHPVWTRKERRGGSTRSSASAVG